MRKIDEDAMDEKYILLIPAMFDYIFPLLKFAFYSKNYHPVILENEENITDIGLKYVNNDMCYPSILNIGQLIGALQSGKYDINKTMLLMPAAGDACRGSNYGSVLRRALKHAGFPNVRVLALNLKGIDKKNMLKLNFSMVIRALFGAFYGDILMLLINQTRPYEKNKGDSKKMYNKWVKILSDDIKKGKHLTIHNMKKNFYRISKDFATIGRIDNKKQRVGIVGELYIKYCHLGNWNMIDFLEEHGCESHTNGLSWYAMYYMDSHMMDSSFVERNMYKIGLKFFANIQNSMINALKKYNFYTLENFETLKKEASEYVSMNFKTGDGWLIGAEIVGHALHNCDKVLAVQPFGCMPNHCCGRGLYPYLQRNVPNLKFAYVDVDSSGSKANVYNRVCMLIDW